MTTPVGQVLGTQDAMPLDFWVAVATGQFLELDDVVVVNTALPNGQTVTLYGVVDVVKARHEGVQFDTDVFRVSEGTLPAGIALSAHVAVTRIEPEIYVPPLPGQSVSRAVGLDREQALFFDRMARRFPLGLSRDGQVIYGNVEFLDGSRGAHVNISGISGVATKTTYATFLLHSVFRSGALGARGVNARAIIFNVKGEDLLFLDQPNRLLAPAEAAKYAALGLPMEAFVSAQFLAPPQRGNALPLPATGARQQGVTAFYWSLLEFCQGRYLRFLFAEADDESSQLGYLVDGVEAKLAATTRPDPLKEGAVEIDGDTVASIDDLVELLRNRVDTAGSWGGAAAAGTRSAFMRRLEAGVGRVGHLVRAETEAIASAHRIDWNRQQLTVIDIHGLHDRGKRFVVGAVLKRMFEQKEALGTADPLVFVVLDELNKYAPREGWSPIKDVLLDIAERGRSLGIVLIGAQQTASEVERRIVANAAFRIVGRLDTAESQRDEYGFLPAPARLRAGILKPGTLIVHQPEIPVPLLVQFPFPAWATRASEAALASGDPFRGLVS
jgi:DNA helicase HerA-like ATPase